jgi:uncharacterized protein YndB with AHSA1/START domain
MTKIDIIADPGKQEFMMTRLFEAPPELVFKVYTDPKLISQWWGPDYLTTTVERMEVKPGGIWRFVQRDATGQEFSFHGVYHEVSTPNRLVQTFEFEGTPGHVVLETISFSQEDGKTRITEHSVFQSVADRDEMIAEGMEQGATRTLERLEEIFAGMKASR